MKKILGIFVLCFVTGVVSGQSIEDCSVCSNRLLTPVDVQGKTLEELALLRNEIYARKGYVFSNERYQYYFEASEWYQALNDNDRITLSDIERQNVDLLKSLEERERTRRDMAMEEIQRLKDALNEGRTDDVSIFLASMKADFGEHYQYMADDLKNALNHINLSDLHWFLGRGFYSMTIDNGFQVSSCSISLERDSIVIKTGIDRGSANYRQGDDHYSHVFIDEHMIIWIFEISDNGIRLVKCDMAG